MAGRGAVSTLRPVAVAAGFAGCACLATLAPATDLAGRTDERQAVGVSARDVTAVTAGSFGERAATTDVRGVPDGRLISAMSRVDCRTRKCVALTFDDGPMTSTARLLDTLAAGGARATFFLVGRNVDRFPQLVRREVMEGHELANHTYSHLDLRQASTAKGTRELRRTQEAIRRVTGTTPVLMRPPYGATDKRVAAIAKRMKLTQVLWSLDSLDWQVRDSKKVERKVVAGTRNGAIVLMHDIHPTTVAAVPGIIKRLRAKGYFFVTVSELFGKPLVPGKTLSKR
jgi:peptidoglycan/xylan/chitin deacetylase (PgdA/CDA1 family)